MNDSIYFPNVNAFKHSFHHPPSDDHSFSRLNHTLSCQKHTPQFDSVSYDSFESERNDTHYQLAQIRQFEKDLKSPKKEKAGKATPSPPAVRPKLKQKELPSVEKNPYQLWREREERRVIDTLLYFKKSKQKIPQESKARVSHDVEKGIELFIAKMTSNLPTRLFNLSSSKEYLANPDDPLRRVQQRTSALQRASGMQRASIMKSIISGFSKKSLE